ncbi:GIY-YIG nuclease family protein [Roseivirga pacifica]|uniref:GIY-YIG nuclease family protein n=1 Tax=Roseivirga pacifica TaxID=1267423 RepID=UPI00227A498A|nr:GIY-YIG nuclease family protein [Roseivirga pacifica]
MHTVYILLCSDGKFYTGCTSNLEKRLKKHLKGEVTSTSYRLPVELETYIVFKDKYKAYSFEKYLKSGSGIAFRNKRLI